MQNLIIPILTKLPLDTLIQLVTLFFVVLSLVLVPWWVYRVEKRMAEIHKINNQMHSDGLDRKRVRDILRDVKEDVEEHREKFVGIGLTMERMNTKIESILQGQERIMEKLNIV